MTPFLLPLAQTDAPSGGSAIANLLPLVLIVAVFYFLLIRPQQRRARKHAELVGSISTGDRIVTVGGVHGTVRTVDEDTMTVEVAPGTVLTVTRSAIARKLVDADGAGAAEA